MVDRRAVDAAGALSQSADESAIASMSLSPLPDEHQPVFMSRHAVRFQVRYR